jgi:hypothetical protein
MVILMLCELPYPFNFHDKNYRKKPIRCQPIWHIHIPRVFTDKSEIGT